jgi:predicted ATP-dependent endonuclease of OLD family
MGNLILNSLEIRRFRGFRHLQIERLERVNLIVGKNNVGKSNLLEALQMYAHRASTPTIISEIMETGGETRQPSEEITCVLVPANGLNREQIIELWDRIALTGLEREVINALRLIAPGVEGLNLVSTPASEGERDLIVNVASIDEPLSLHSLGNGMWRILGIALVLVNAKDGILLIDEIENGIHYSAQPDLWHLIFRIAGQLNVQVFATTHSWDCLKGFQEAAQEDSGEGILIRLKSKKDKIVATLFDERQLGIATREQIEVR